MDWSEINKKDILYYENLGYNKEPRLKLWICILIHFILIFGIFISRMYLGMHTLNQVLFGLAAGVYLHFLYRWKLLVWIKKLLLYLIYPEYFWEKNTKGSK